MSHGPLSIYTVTMASAGTLTGAAVLLRSWKTVFLDVPSLASNTQIHIQGSVDGTTYRRLIHPLANVSSPTGYDFTIPSATTNRLVPIPNGFPYLKVETTATVDSGQAFKIICAD